MQIEISKYEQFLLRELLIEAELKTSASIKCMPRDSDYISDHRVALAAYKRLIDKLA